jgi:hypothetical protein|tara:strand:+ start:228 stop:440 length:213 start_codon:yes stop_codon:yes gene_type:complete
MLITIDEDAVAELTQKILIEQHTGLTLCLTYEPEGEDREVFIKVLAALRVLLSWNCTPEQCVELNIEWKI